MNRIFDDIENIFVNNINNFKIYNKNYENFFLYITEDIKENNDVEMVYKCRNVLNELRYEEYKYLDYFKKNGENKTIDEINKNTNLKLSLQKLNSIYKIIIKNYDIFFLNFFNYIYEIHDRLVFLYNIMNNRLYLKNNNIKIINVNKHNMCVKYILESFRDNTLPSMIFFDSHPDINIPKSYKAENSCIGSVNIPILMNYENNNGLYWITPDDFPISYIESKMYIKNTEKNIYNRLKEVKIIKKVYDNYNNLILYPYIKMNEDCNIEFNNGSLKLFNYTITNIEYFTYFENITDRYILNIDLDYFITYGNINNENLLINKDINNRHFELHNNKKYIYGDIESSKIEKVDFESKNYSHNYNQVNNEIKILRKNIDKFLCFIKELKINGKIPTMIIFSDSTIVDFSIFDSNIGIGNMEKCKLSDNLMINNFLPKRHAFWLKTTLLNNLRYLFEDEFEIL